MEKITKENIESEYSNFIDDVLLYEKELSDSKYYELVNLYKSFFERYLKDKLPLELIDSNMKKSKLNFVPVKEEDMDFYQITSTMGLSYIYLRNNLYIEKLSKEDLDFLSSKTEYDDDTKAFIERTYLDVINPYSDHENHIIFYGPENSKHLCDSRDVVLGIRYSEFEQNGLSDDEFEKNFIGQLKLVTQLSALLEITSPKELGSNLRCIQYNELSIMKKYNGNTK